jgi:hypothetical protein
LDFPLLGSQSHFLGFGASMFFFYCFWGSFRSHLFDFFVVCSCPTCWDYGTYFMLGLCVFL